ncbi:apical endosomal glycoprotein [Bombina bombina]|uniref:apical endosomal glycoprotein n=1 Tax=Bombina bombina TaxID=8345 RepID=UPI00235AE7C1|nr:apical endosomal glycoprotein [Bombina bombina]
MPDIKDLIKVNIYFVNILFDMKYISQSKHKTPHGAESPPEIQCNFVCDLWDCADERHCGFHKDSPVWGVPFSCDFEQDDCGWKDTSTTSYKWVRDRRRGSQAHGDHTLGTKWGWFMATEGHRGKSAVTATLRSPVLQNAAATCEIHLHYHMWAPDSPSVNGSLSLDLVDATQIYSLWVSPRSSALDWRQAVVYTGRMQGPFQLIISSTLDSSTQADITIDDLEFRHCSLSAPQAECHSGQEQCARGSCVGKDALCDGTDDCGDNSDESKCEGFRFCGLETDFCDWSSDWERVNRSETSKEQISGTRSGGFLRVGSSRKATISSPNLQAASNESCYLVLYYLMDGSSANRLVVKYQNSTKNEFRIEGRRGPVWVRERVPVLLSAAAENFQITIVGELGTEPDAVIALNYVILSPECKLVPGPANVTFHTQSSGLDHYVSSGKAVCQGPSGRFDFEADLAGWMDQSIGKLKWGRDNSALPDAGSTGYYLSVQSAGGQLLSRAEVRSPIICSSGPTCAINMTYYFNGGPAGFLSVRIVDPELGTHTHVWRSQGEHSASWKFVTIPVGERPRPFQVVLHGSVDLLPERKWAVAVDDIQFVGCETKKPSVDQAPVTCNFDTSFCGWYQDQTEEIDWELGTISDHTTGNGKFLYVSGDSRMDRGMRARLVTYPQSSGQGQQCLSLYYRIRGPDSGTLNLLMKPESEEEKLLWTVTGTHGNRWHREAITLQNSANKMYQLVLDAVRDGSVGHIAVDDITLRSGPCDPPTRCSFEAGSCSFSSKGTHTWKLHQNMRGNSEAAPFHDHTQQSFTGHYMLVDTSAAAMPNKKSAVLISSTYSAWPDKGCLSFWYQLGGSNPGVLNVYFEEDSGKKKTKSQLLSVSKAHANSWHYKSVTLQPGAQWVLMFEAVGAGGDRSFIALDDIHMSHHPCHEAASCDFEMGSCSWTNVRFPVLDTYDWDWTSGAALIGQSSAPEKDHTLGTSEGHFAFVDTGALHTEGSSAWLMSEHLPATSGSCFSFSYRTDSADHFHLAELVMFVTSTQGLLPVWVLQGFHSSDWQEQQLQLNSTVEFQIVFEASKGTRPHAATIALDDLRYSLDTPCNAVKKEKAGKDNTGKIVVILIVVILLLMCVIAVVMLYRKRKRNLEGAPQISSQVDGMEGFENIVFEGDGASSS